MRKCQHWSLYSISIYFLDNISSVSSLGPTNNSLTHFPFKLIDANCKDKMPKIWNKYSQKRSIGASVPISTFICLWANFIFPRWVCLFCWRKYVDWSWEYINRSKTHECGNWGWVRAIPRKGIYKRNCRCSAVQNRYIIFQDSDNFTDAYIIFSEFFCSKQVS